MDNLRISDNQQPQKRQICSVLLLRWFIGSLAGCINGLILFAASETFFPPILGPIIAGQEELFDELIYLVSNNYSSSAGSLIIYTTVWALIGALLASGRKKQIMVGLILLIIYVIAGGMFYMIWGLMSLAT